MDTPSVKVESGIISEVATSVQTARLVKMEYPGARRAARAALVDRSACIVVTRASSS